MLAGRQRYLRPAPGAGAGGICDGTGASRRTGARWPDAGVVVAYESRQGGSPAGTSAGAPPPAWLDDHQAWYTRYCEQRQITFTRGRPYKKNDQAYIEQKNWTAIRQTVGYDRFEGSTACALLSAVHEPLRLYLNFFQPVMVLVRKERVGAKVKRYYDRAKTPQPAGAGRT